MEDIKSCPVCGSKETQKIVCNQYACLGCWNMYDISIKSWKYFEPGFPGYHTPLTANKEEVKS